MLALFLGVGISSIFFAGSLRPRFGLNDLPAFFMPTHTKAGPAENILDLLRYSDYCINNFLDRMTEMVFRRFRPFLLARRAVEELRNVAAPSRFLRAKVCGRHDTQVACLRWRRLRPARRSASLLFGDSATDRLKHRNGLSRLNPVS